MRYLLLIAILISASACSVYQSDAREFLEKDAYSFAGVEAQANLVGCTAQPRGEDWTLMQESSEAKVYSHEREEFNMRVQPAAENSDFGCDFHFASAQEMFEKTTAAIALAKLYLSLGEFAFHPISPLK